MPTEAFKPICLNSRRLSVEVAQPGTIYQGTRFDWTGFVTQVVLDGKHTFCIPESLTPGQGTGGIGICNEFGIDIGTGYAEAGEADSFPKFGVGLLRRGPKEKYSFWDPRPIVQPFSIEMSSTETSVTFTIEPVDCMGYAARQTKTLTVLENQLEIAYRMENTGSKPIKTNEYVHNFVAIDDLRLGPDYQVTFPYEVTLEKTQAPVVGMMKLLPGFLRARIDKAYAEKSIEPLEMQGNSIRVKQMPQRSFYCRTVGYERSEQPQWELRHLSSGVSMREYDDFAPCRVAMWGEAHVISVEVFVEIDLQPGQAMSWKRRFEFNA